MKSDFGQLQGPQVLGRYLNDIKHIKAEDILNK